MKLCSILLSLILLCSTSMQPMWVPAAVEAVGEGIALLAAVGLATSAIQSGQQEQMLESAADEQAQEQESVIYENLTQECAQEGEYCELTYCTLPDVEQIYEDQPYEEQHQEIIVKDYYALNGEGEQTESPEPAPQEPNPTPNPDKDPIEDENKDKQEEQPDWDMPTGCGKNVNGIEYTDHALERMAPKTTEVIEELTHRQFDKLPGPLSLEEVAKTVDPRGIPPSVVQHAIQTTEQTMGKYPFTWQHATEDLLVILNEFDQVISVIPK